ncbi:MAG: carboxypeptidase-like regulatory domain-containing protein [Bacteroidales bacterium]|nr:carboxypeptidase-like regulatory domain-containing protein [Bacteroidales bacterium]
MKGRLLILLLLIAPLWLQAQTVSGTVTDAATGETLMGATILDEITGKGTITNAYGRYTTWPPIRT